MLSSCKNSMQTMKSLEMTSKPLLNKHGFGPQLVFTGAAPEFSSGNYIYTL